MLTIRFTCLGDTAELYRCVTSGQSGPQKLSTIRRNLENSRLC